MDRSVLYIMLWALSTAGYSISIYVLLKRRAVAAARGERWVSLTHWTSDGGTDNWYMAVNRVVAIAIAVAPMLVVAVYLALNHTLAAGELPLATWFLLTSQCALVGILWVDWASAKAAESAQKQMTNLQTVIVLTSLLFALVSAAGLWLGYRQMSLAQLQVGNVWETTERLAETLRMDPAFDLQKVQGHLNLISLSPVVPYELYEIGERKRIFPFRERSYAGLRRWRALDSLLEALVEDAKRAARKKDWNRCREALQAALYTMEIAASLQVPEDLKPRLDPHLVPVRSFALIHIIGGYQVIYPLVREIALLSPAHRLCMEYAIQQGRRVREVLGDSARRSQPFLGARLQPEQHHQLEIIADETLHQLSLELVRWRLSIEDGLVRLEQTDSQSAQQAQERVHGKRLRPSRDDTPLPTSPRRGIAPPDLPAGGEESGSPSLAGKGLGVR